MIALASCGGAIALGLVLMALGTQAVLEEVVQASETIGEGTILKIDVEMNSDEEPVGVFAVQILETTEQLGVSAKVLDPFGSIIATADVPKDSVEGRFDVDVDGVYSLIVENDANEKKILTFGAIGPLPDVSSKALAFIPFYLLLSGIMGMAGLGVYGVASMRKMRKN